MALLVFATTIIVEVVKGLFPKVPTNIVAVIVALIVTILAVIILCAVMEITVMWYYAVGAVVLGIFVAYASMFGFDKFKATWERLKKMGIQEWIAEKRASGAIRQVGFSYHGNSDMFCRLVDAYDWDFCQIQFNYMDTQVQAGLKGYELAKSKNIPMVIMEPIKGGQLANVPEEIKTVFREIHPDWSDAAWALRFVASFDNVYCVLSGMSNFEQTLDNLNTFENFESFTKEEFAAVAKAKDLFDARVQVPCTGCRYCMPCPFGVNIPHCFRTLNDSHIYNQMESGRKQYAAMDGKAELCQKCGACMVECPQHIEIPTMLEKVTEQLG